MKYVDYYVHTMKPVEYEPESGPADGVITVAFWVSLAAMALLFIGVIAAWALAFALAPLWIFR